MRNIQEDENMATVYLCIGTQKTGTTSLQYFMRANEDVLKKQSYSYPYMELGMSDAFYKNRNAHFLVYHSSDMEEERQKKQDAYRILGELAKEYDNIVLSDEIIWYQCNNIENFWQDACNEFQKINCTLKVVVYLRRQDSIIQSLWNQKVKGLPGITEDFQTYFQEEMFAYFPLDYYEQLQKIASFVGKEYILVRVYENGQFGGVEHNLISDYLETLGVELNDEFRMPEETLNHGLAGNFVEMKRLLNGIKEYQKMENFMRMPMTYASDHHLEHNPEGKTNMFTYEEQMDFLKRYEESNARTAREFLGRKDGILFREPIPKLPVWEVNHDEMYQDLFIFMVEMFCAQEKKISNLTQKVNQMKKQIARIENSENILGTSDSLIARGYRKNILKNKE